MWCFWNDGKWSSKAMANDMIKSKEVLKVLNNMKCGKYLERRSQMSLRRG